MNREKTVKEGRESSFCREGNGVFLIEREGSFGTTDGCGSRTPLPSLVEDNVCRESR